MSSQATTAPKVIFITGATAGLGLATAKALRDSAQEPTVIILTSRDGARGEAAVKSFFDKEEASRTDVRVVVKELALDEDESIEKLRGEIEREYGKGDVLVNNAAVHLDFSVGEDKGQVSIRDAFNRSCNTNIASTFLFTHALLPLLFASSTRRLVFISSGISSLNDHSGHDFISINQAPPAGLPKFPHFNIMTYRTSKTGANMMALEMARILRNDNVKVHILDPGLLVTTLGGADPVVIKQMGGDHPSVGGAFVRDVVEGKWDEHVETLLNKDGPLPW